MSPAGVVGSLCHVGVVVRDLEAAQRELTEAVGATWRPWQERPDGDRTMRISFSETEPYLELIEAGDEGIWENASGPRLHHIAYWTDDVPGECANLASLGIGQEAGGTSIWGGSWGYFRLPESGIRVEMCGTAGRQKWRERWGFAT